MLNVNPLNTNSWKMLKEHFSCMKNVKITDLFLNNKFRFRDLSFNFKDKILIDCSKNIITLNTIKLFVNLLKEINFSNYLKSMLLGSKINVTENRSVLHVALRDRRDIFFNKNNNFLSIKNDVNKNLKKMKLFTKLILEGKFTGFTGKKIKNIVNIGIGGSDLGSKMVINSLNRYKNNLNIYFVSNIDIYCLRNILKKINIECTLFIICSKTFTTLETISNAEIIKKIVIDFYGGKSISIEKHFIAVTNNVKKAEEFGISLENIFMIFDWTGGRFSLCSSVGLTICLSIGFDNFLKMLDGFHDMDLHFFNCEYHKNIPIILAMISIWYINFFRFDVESVLVYKQNLLYFPLYLQQLIMESNGKCVDRNGNFITDYCTSSVIFGGVGTDVQHSFFQYLHQGTKCIPCDFIAEIYSDENINNSHLKLMSNFFAQTHTLAFGDKRLHNSNYVDKNNFVNKFNVFKGNKPSNSILINKITPYTLGSIISLYEHKVFTQGIILNIFSFDQWGVELGKKISSFIFTNLLYKTNSNLDKSTDSLVSYFNDNYNN